MKKIILPLLFIFILLSGVAQNDTLFFMKNGMITQIKAISEIDSIVFHRPILDAHGTFLDTRDSNIYQTIIIGNQLWMAENLRYLPSVSSPVNNSPIAPYYFVNNYWGGNVSLAKLTCAYIDYGALYNWSAANVACPTGWHLPTSEEWNTMITFLGGESNVGITLKEPGNTHWNFPNFNVTNESEFSALPGGMKDISSLTFFELGNYGYWWTSSEIDILHAKLKRLQHNSFDILNEQNNKSVGLSVRCIAN
jgi:uncharacterized protein (TIGR02145 family)